MKVKLIIVTDELNFGQNTSFDSKYTNEITLKEQLTIKDIVHFWKNLSPAKTCKNSVI